ncbi:hypothetical protein AC579_721 [Pseudocercospora musae]|uniref:Uncharacterized protein n=1 Tax=Pseudocercospora musae TaxID=113226 RepID=A0A139I4D6_9PEZI|nr:hypothetical protein AC579_721 [Pseudocercospora musae]
MAVDFYKERRVLRGPHTVFDGSIQVGFLEPDGIDASVLIKTTVKAGHPLVEKGKKHAISESFKVLSGKFGLTKGYEQKDFILTPESAAYEIPPMQPRYPWVVADTNGEDSVVLAWAHPTSVPKAMDDEFFETIFLHVSQALEQGRVPNSLQLMLSQHETNSCGVVLPSAWWLGGLRWWIPRKVQGALAAVARVMGYKPMLEKVDKQK